MIKSKIAFRFKELENDLLKKEMKIKEIIFYPKSYGCDKKVDLNKVLKKYSQILIFLEKSNRSIFSNVNSQLRIIQRHCHLYESNQKYWEFTIVPVLEDSKGKRVNYKWKE